MRNVVPIVPDYAIQMTPIPVHRIAHDWAELLSYIRPAKIKGGTFDEMGLMRDLMAGTAEAAFVTGTKMKGAFVSQIIDGKCTINYLGGRINARPREWMLLVRWGMAAFEDLARKAGCKTMHLSGRNWSRALSVMGYERVADGLPNEMRKVL